VFDLGGLGLQEVLMIVDGRCGECPVYGATAEVALPCGFGIASALEFEIDAGAFGQVGNGVHEGERFKIHDEFYGIAALFAAETMVKVPLRMHGERRSFFGMVGVRAEADEAGSLAPEGNELGGYLDDVSRFADLLYAAL
jgi:hypothetical protein